VLGSSFHLVWEAAPGRFLASLAPQIVTAITTGAQLVITRDLIAAVLATGTGGDLGRVGTLLGEMIGLSVISSAAGLVQSQQQSMLSAIVERHTNSVLLDRIIAIDLKRFETPEFQDLLRRAMNAMGRMMGVTGAARGSIAGEVRGGGARTLGSNSLPGVPAAMGEMIGIVGSPIPYVAVINDGRRPGQPMPPPEALELWVRRKIQWSRDRKGPRGGRQRLTTAEARSIAFVIARAIGRRGTKGVHFYEEALAANQDQIRQIFEAAGLKISMRLTQPN